MVKARGGITMVLSSPNISSRFGTTEMSKFLIRCWIFTRLMPIVSSSMAIVLELSVLAVGGCEQDDCRSL